LPHGPASSHVVRFMVAQGSHGPVGEMMSEATNPPPGNVTEHIHFESLCLQLTVAAPSQSK